MLGVRVLRASYFICLGIRGILLVSTVLNRQWHNPVFQSPQIKVQVISHAITVISV